MNKIKIFSLILGLNILVPVAAYYGLEAVMIREERVVTAMLISLIFGAAAGVYIFIRVGKAYLAKRRSRTSIETQVPVILSKTLLDTKNKLEWELKTPENANISLSYDDSQLYVNELNIKSFNGYNDWRLPTLEELKELVHLDSHALLSDSSFYWGSGADDEELSWAVDINSGHVYGFFRQDTHCVCCVRTTE